MVYTDYPTHKTQPNSYLQWAHTQFYSTEFQEGIAQESICIPLHSNTPMAYTYDHQVQGRYILFHYSRSLEDRRSSHNHSHPNVHLPDK